MICFICLSMSICCRSSDVRLQGSAHICRTRRHLMAHRFCSARVKLQLAISPPAGLAGAISSFICEPRNGGCVICGAAAMSVLVGYWAAGLPHS